jgi:hypothetical protein
MTPAEIRAAHEARKTLPDRLMDPKLTVTGEAARLCREAAEALRWYEEALRRERANLIEEQREARRAVGEAVAEERFRQRDDEYMRGY